MVISKDEARKVSFLVWWLNLCLNLTRQVSRYLVKHYFGCFWESVLGMCLTFKLLAFEWSRLPTVMWMILYTCRSGATSYLFATPWTADCQASFSFTVLWSFFKCMSIESVMLSRHLILCHSLLLLSVFPSITVFSNEFAFTSGGQSIGASASASVLPRNIWGWFPLGLTGLISLQSKGFSIVFSRTTIWKCVCVCVCVCVFCGIVSLQNSKTP